MTEDVFTGWIECWVYERSERIDVGERSSVTKGEFCGWVSLSARDIEFTDDEIFSLLDSAHARQSFIQRFLELHNAATSSLEEVGVTKSGVSVDKVSMEFQVSESYLNEVIREMDGGEKVINSLQRYDTPITIVSRDDA